MYHSSYQNSNFLNSKASHYIQQSQYIIQQAQNFPSLNKQNYSYQLNKSHLSQRKNQQMNRSNNSQRSVMAKDKSSMMMASKSQSILLGQSKAKNFIDINERSKMSTNNRSMLKSQNNGTKKGPVLKVLTESDLTENDEMDDHMFSDSESQQQEIYRANTHHQNNRSLYSSKSQKMITSNHYSTLGSTKNIHPQLMNQQSRQIPQSNQTQNRRLSTHQQQSQSHYSSEQSSCIEVPEFTLIPNIKLQIRHYCPKHKNKLSFQQLVSLLPHQISALKKVKKLSVINCCINSLEGIQQFECLEEINLRKNQLREVEELYRIKNKQNIISINILGNDIEYYHLGRYRALSQVFVNLQELNDKNYAMLKKKQRGDMKKILHKTSKLQYELRKTLKKQIRSTDRAILRMNPNLLSSQGQQTQRTNRSNHKYSQNNAYHEVSDNKVTQRDEYSYENYNSSLTKRSASQVKSPTYQKRRQVDDENEVYEVQQGGLNPNSYSLGQSSKEKSFCKTTNKHELKQVSLGNLENVPITRSVKCNQNKLSPSKKTKKQQSHNKQNINLNQIPLQTTVPIAKNLLEIRTQDLDNQSDLASHLHQPTATFAMQKEREQQCSAENRQFMFRNNKRQGQNNKVNGKIKAKRDNNEQEIFEEMQNDEEENNNEMSLSRISRISQIPTKRLSNNRRSMTSNNLRTYEQKSRLIDPYQNTSQQSFITSNQFYPNYQNTSYMGFSQLSQWRPNESMDDDCLLKEKKDLLEEEKLVIATAMYMQGLLRKAMRGLIGEGFRRKNMPKKRVFF